MAISQHGTRTSGFTVSVEHVSGVSATVHSDGSLFRLEARRGATPYLTVDLGLDCDGELLGASSVLVDATTTKIVEDYVAHAGKTTGMRAVRHEEIILVLRTPAGRQWCLVVRAAPDGIAFRYRLPETEGALDLGKELTTYHLAPGGRVWTLEYQTWYETERVGIDTAGIQSGDYGFPTLVDQGDNTWVLLSESAIDGRSSGAHLVREPGTLAGELRVAAADVPLSVESGHETPWRVAFMGSLAEIVASNLVDDLAPAANPDVQVVARPGRGAWSWWSSQYSGAYLSVQKRFTDFAADQGWEHVLVDCGWDSAWVPDLVDYASRRGIQVHLWSSWSDLDGLENLRKLELWKSWGVAGIKVDFMESESRERYRWYDAIIAEAEHVGLMLNFHGSVIPRGWARTHPNVISYEGIRGAEYYVFYGTPLTAAHNVIQPFTRNVVGSMDYTPVAFSAPGRETSDGHELALSVAYESGITHFADDPAQYKRRPLAARFMAMLPPAWHEVRLLDGHPDRHAIIARRHKETWYVGAIATGSASTVEFDPTQLLSDYTGWLVADDDSAGQLAEKFFDASDGAMTVALKTNGGFVAVLAPNTQALQPAALRPTQTPVIIEPTRALAGLTDGALVSVETGAKLISAPGWDAESIREGLWRVRPPADAVPGAVGVITFQRGGHTEVPATGHVKLFVPLTSGRHSLVTLPYLTARNSFGPVEKDQSNGGGDPNDGQPIAVAGKLYSHGLGVSDDSSIEFFLGGQGGTFTSSVGIDDETSESSARIVIVLDGVTVEEFIIRGGFTPRDLVIDLAQISVLELRTEPDPSIAAQGHVDWIDPYITLDD